ncbi:hypothetical protein BCR44DRAFT_266347 [Catenaria anguillulae PL171]|uniref:Uncharacterized protein n=1 Tax=Catenaria anguillulae PL171 TaxID=765915 RepID=A0A1Y2HBI0_9FUNG|nr:hypothetical protein BCR44DRAFT_266347 [Catenaria anguillulae PL171]
MHSSTSAVSSSHAPNDVSIANAEGQRSELPPPTVLLEAPVQHQPTSAFAISGSTSSPAATAAGMSASAEAASVGQDATNASLPGLSAEHLGATVDACRGSDAVLNSVTHSGGGIGIAEPAISATATVILPRMVLPSHYASQPAPVGPSQPSALGFVQRPQSPTLPSTSSQPSPPESATVSHPPTNTAQQFYAYYRSQGGLVYQQPYQQPYQHSQQHYQQPQLQSAVQGGQHGYYPQPQQHFTLTGASGSGLITSPQASGVAPDQPSVTNNGNHVLSSPPSFGPRSQAPVPMASPNSSAAAINMHSAISNTWPQPLQQGSASMAGPVLVPTATNADVATHSPPALSTAPADMDHAATVAAAAMATMINNANSVQQRAMDTEPAAALPSMMFSSNASTPPSPMDSLAMAAAAVAAASASATAATSAASSNGNSPPTLGTASNSPAARPRATRLRPPQPYPIRNCTDPMDPLATSKSRRSRGKTRSGSTCRGRDCLFAWTSLIASMSGGPGLGLGAGRRIGRLLRSGWKGFSGKGPRV